MRQDCDEEGKVRQEKKDAERETLDKERGRQPGKILKGLRKVKKHTGHSSKRADH